MPACCVCRTMIDEPIFVSSETRSMTTMLRLYDEPTVVHFCDRCGHLQTSAIVDTEDYYAHQYAILAESEEEDQIYQVVDGRPIFQVEHRLRTLQSKLSLPQGARVLDYGCAKGAFLRALQRGRPDVQPYFFDVTERYRSFWRAFAPSDRCATGTLPAEWRGQMDAVVSFYVLEHVADPRATVDEMAALLRPNGCLYFVVPNVQANVADFAVADHLQHYSARSITHLLDACGMTVVDIDDQIHHAAYVVVARLGRSPDELGWTNQQRHPGDETSHRRRCETISDLRRQYEQTAQFWKQLARRIRDHEARLPRENACIYGAGFYGHFIWSCLQEPARIRFFIDQNPYLQGRTVAGVPIVSPMHRDPSVKAMYVGLNPTTAKSIIATIPEQTRWPWKAFYL